LILTIYDKLPNSPSWRFVPKSYVFANSANPWGTASGDPSKVGFPEKIEIKSIDKDQLNNDFIGIKVGDVNGTVLSHQLLGNEIRGAGPDLKFRTLDRQLKAGEETTIEFTADNFSNIEGYQFSLAINGLELKGIQSGLLKVTEANFGMTKLGEGYVTTSWNQNYRGENLTATSHDVLFSIKVRAVKALMLSEVLVINSKYTRAEAYNNKTGNATSGVSLVVGNKSSAFTLYQNTPNPFKTSTIIGFDLVRNDKVTLKITDVTGKLIKVLVLDGIKGSNQIKVNQTDLLGSGVFYYTLETKESRATKKLVLLN
ncbi:MAG: T9SS type A sorting domain-containing protein, partial [Saprospiraceae bacterium]